MTLKKRMIGWTLIVAEIVMILFAIYVSADVMFVNRGQLEMWIMALPLFGLLFGGSVALVFTHAWFIDGE